MCGHCGRLVGIWWRPRRAELLKKCTALVKKAYEKVGQNTTWFLHFWLCMHCKLGQFIIIKKYILTTPQALQLYFFLIIENGCEHSIHLWIASSLSKWGCLLPISASGGLKTSRPNFKDDFFWYNSLMASNKDSNQSSFSLLVLKNGEKEATQWEQHR